MSDKKFVIFYHESQHKYFYTYSLWFDVTEKYSKPILYSDNFKLIEKVKKELNEQLQKQGY